MIRDLEAARIGTPLRAMAGFTSDKFDSLVEVLMECSTQEHAIKAVKELCRAQKWFPTPAEMQGYISGAGPGDHAPVTHHGNPRCVECFGEGWQRIAVYRNGDAYEAVRRCQCLKTEETCSHCDLGVRGPGGRLEYCRCPLGVAKYNHDKVLIARKFSGCSHIPLGNVEVA